MGCTGSKSAFDKVDDSVNMMIQHDKKVAKQKGLPTTGFVPRGEHPLLQNGENEASGSSTRKEEEKQM
jgi:hypothetical protein